ncbi:hypothetical protein GCM10009791_09330 [Citricoccus zhacaiensis]
MASRPILRTPAPIGVARAIQNPRAARTNRLPAGCGAGSGALRLRWVEPDGRADDFADFGSAPLRAVEVEDRLDCERVGEVRVAMLRRVPASP